MTTTTTTIPRLPQELIDHIIDHVNDRESLKACSFVCSQWSPRTRKHLFSQVEFASQRDLERWCARIHPGPSGLPSLVEDLTLSEYHPHHSPKSPLPFWLRSPIFTNAAPHFQSFSALRVLEIQRWLMSIGRISSMVHSFGSSLENVTRLTLRDVTAYPRTLAMFVSHFPRLDDLSVSIIYLPRILDGTGDLHPRFRGDIVPIHPRGYFSVSNILVRVPKGVFKAITLLEPRFRQITLAHASYGVWRDYWPLVEACAGSLEELRILADVTGADCHELSLACCPNLRKIVLSLGGEMPTQPSKFVEKCLSTITSNQLSEVSLCLLGDIPELNPPAPNSAQWDPLDIILYDLAGKYRPRYEGDRMMVELVNVNPDLSEAGHFLWRYRERGTLRVASATRVKSSEG